MAVFPNTKLWVFNIERFAIHDGPGIRTVVFLQGCPLECQWCANPESKIQGRKIMHLDQKCSGCGHCISNCTQHAISIQNGKAWIDRKKCSGCGSCVSACPNGVNQISGRQMTLKEIYDVIVRDLVYYQESGGGVTFSGGEALLHIDALLSLLKEVRKLGVSVAVETCGNVALQKVKEAIPWTDYFLYDLKSMDQETLRKYTNGDLSLILENLEEIARAGCCNIIIRMPVIPSVNFSRKEIEQVFKEAKKQQITRVDLLPYHTLGITKYRQLGYSYEFGIRESLSPEQLEEYIEIGKVYGLQVKIGGSPQMGD